jgi:hypothetical protein
MGTSFIFPALRAAPRRAAPWESLPPLVIITAAVTVMGGIQQGKQGRRHVRAGLDKRDNTSH